MDKQSVLLDKHRNRICGVQVRDDMTPEVWIAIITGLFALLSGIVSGILIWRQKVAEEKTKRLQLESERLQGEAERIQTERNQHLDFTKTLLGRVEKLEERQDTILDETRSQVKEVVMEYEAQLDALQEDMKKLRMESTMEVSFWRDKYYTLMAEYQDLKLKQNELMIENASVMAKLAALDVEHNRILIMYNKMIGKQDSTAGV